MKPVILHGGGTSIWGKSKGKWIATKWYVSYDSKEWTETRGKDSWFRFISVDVQGPHLPDVCYTDQKIAREVEAWIEKKLLKEYKCDDVSVSWSEWGMQHDGKWNFDVTLTVFHKPPTKKGKSK